MTEFELNLRSILGPKESWLKAMRLLNPDAQISDESYDATVKAIIQLFNDEVIGEDESELVEDSKEGSVIGNYHKGLMEAKSRIIRNKFRDQLREKLGGKEGK